MSQASNNPPALKRVVGLFGAVGLGLGSILGTGVFVSLAIVTDIAGPDVLWAVGLAAILATCNGLSSAQLAAAHPVSGGTYEYGDKYVHPLAGYGAGWLFLVAKSASAATGALGLAGYLTEGLGLAAGTRAPTTIAMGLVAVTTLLAVSGLKRSTRVNTIIVSITVGALGLFVVTGLLAMNQGQLPPESSSAAEPAQPWNLATLFQATALAFVAYTGYGRVATLGEEITEPRRNIPRAIIITLLVSMVLYMAVAAVALHAVGPGLFASAGKTGGAPLEQVTRYLGYPDIAKLIALGASTAMAGVLLNLILGLSRVLLAMARRHEMPPALATLNPADGNPRRAVIAVGILITLMVSLGDITKTWSLSAFCVLIYYGTTNLAALRMPDSERLYPKLISWVGLIGCLTMAVFVDRQSLLLGSLALLVAITIRRLQPAAPTS